MRIVHLSGYYDPGAHVRSSFGIGGYLIGEFPLTYTVAECVDVWCERVGWKLICLVSWGGNLYVLKLGVETNEDIYQTISRNRVICV